MEFIVRTSYLSNAEPPPCRGVSYQSCDSDIISKFDDGLIGLKGGMVMVKRESRKGLRTHPCGIPVFRIRVNDA